MSTPTLIAPEGRSMKVPLTKIRDAQIKLRGRVKADDPKYLQLKESIRQNGILNAPSFSEIEDPQNPGEKLYQLIDGLHRCSAARELAAQGLDKFNIIDGTVFDAIDAVRVLQLQIQGNTQNIPTKPVDIAKAVNNILSSDPSASLVDLATYLSKSVETLRELLKLEKLTEPLQKLVNDSQISVLNGQMLARLPQEQQTQYTDQAMTMQGQEFVDLIRQVVSNNNAAKAQGKETAGPPQFTPRPKMRNLKDLMTELESGLPNVLPVIAATGASSPGEIITATLKWAVELDEPTLAVKKTAFDNAQAAAAQKAAEREAEKAAKKLAKDAANPKAKEDVVFGPP